MIDRATAHAIDVVNNQSDWGALHIAACQRHLNDLEKAKLDTYPYYWDENSSEALLDFGETLNVIEGFETINVKLMDFQCFDLGVRRGWKYKEEYIKDEKVIKQGRAHKKRFRRSYISMARQNGKTFLNGIEGTNIAGFSGYRNGKLCTAATKQKQARLAWEEMKKFIEGEEDLSELFVVKDYNNTITSIDTGCIIEAISRERAIDEGFRYVFASIDEIHQHKDNKVYKAIYNGTKGLSETLVSMITTRGDNPNSFCYEMDTYAVKILQGVASAEDFFVDIYCLDEGDDYYDIKNIKKANPRLAHTSSMETLIADMETAKDMGGKELRDYITKTLNMWTKNTDDSFVNPDKFMECGSLRTLNDFKGKRCFVGLDLSSGGDLTTVALEFECEEEKDKYYYYTHSFMPKGRLQEHIESDLAPYDIWESEGLITVTGGENDYKNDYKFIISHLEFLRDTYSLEFLGIGYDPHNADGIIQDLETFGCELMMITQSAKFLNSATVDMKLNIKSGKFEYDVSNELMAWSFTNAKLVRNSFGEEKVDKEPRALTKRIDPVDACIDAHVMRLANRDEKVDVNEVAEQYMNMMKKMYERSK